jgi:hypothetical protein
LVACVPALEERERVDRSSFGSVVATLMCKRIAYQESLAAAAETGTVDVAGELYADACSLGLAAPPGAPPALAAFLAMRPRLVAAIEAGATPTYVNWGSYRSSWIIAGVGVTSDF